MTDTTNIIGLPTAKNQTRATLEELKRDLDVIIEFKKLDAELKRIHYLALIKQGFTASEALFIIMKGQ